MDRTQANYLLARFTQYPATLAADVVVADLAGGFYGVHVDTGMGGVAVTATWDDVEGVGVLTLYMAEHADGVEPYATYVNDQHPSAESVADATWALIHDALDGITTYTLGAGWMVDDALTV